MPRFSMSMFIFICCTVFLAGCASPRIFYQAHMTPDQYRADVRQCQYDSEQGVAGYPRAFGIIPSDAERIRRDRLYRFCMQARGYAWVTQEELQAQGGEWSAICGREKRCLTQWP